MDSSMLNLCLTINTKYLIVIRSMRIQASVKI